MAISRHKIIYPWVDHTFPCDCYPRSWGDQTLGANFYFDPLIQFDLYAWLKGWTGFTTREYEAWQSQAVQSLTFKRFIELPSKIGKREAPEILLTNRTRRRKENRTDRSIPFLKLKALQCLMLPFLSVWGKNLFLRRKKKARSLLETVGWNFAS